MRDGTEVAQGSIDTPGISTGRITELGAFTVPLDRLDHAATLRLTVLLGATENHWPLWIFPAEEIEPEPPGILVTHALDDTALNTLQSGGKVLLLAHGLKNSHATRTGFESVYWSAGWWGNAFSSLGVLCDPRHPAFREFPNDGWSDWQWGALCAGATTFNLTGAPPGFRPIVQLVPDFHFNTFLGQVFEARVGGGSLLVCGYDLTRDLAARPAARQFRRSLFRYAGSPSFRPTVELPMSWIETHFQSAGLARRGVTVLHASSEDAPMATSRPTSWTATPPRSGTRAGNHRPILRRMNWSLIWAGNWSSMASPASRARINPMAASPGPISSSCAVPMIGDPR